VKTAERGEYFVATAVLPVDYEHESHPPSGKNFSFIRRRGGRRRQLPAAAALEKRRAIREHERQVARAKRQGARAKRRAEAEAVAAKRRAKKEAARQVLGAMITERRRLQRGMRSLDPTRPARLAPVHGWLKFIVSPWVLGPKRRRTSAAGFTFRRWYQEWESRRKLQCRQILYLDEHIQSWIPECLKFHRVRFDL